MPAVRFAFLDRDGTINVDRGYAAVSENWEFLPRAIEGMRLLQEARYELAVLSNQSGIARGYFDRVAVEDLHVFVTEALAREGVHLRAIQYCPHLPSDHCGCRKPADGMLQEVVANEPHKVDLAESWVIGDKLSDVGLARSAGTRAALLKSAYWSCPPVGLEPDIVSASLYEAARSIVSFERKNGLAETPSSK